ncbi:KR domain-containing protein, partial [Streptomyces asiaticus]
LHTTGTPIDWQAYFADTHAHRIDLPTYPFQHQRYWLDTTPDIGDLAAMGLAPTEHPLLGAMISLPGSGSVVFTGQLSLTIHPWLADHAMGETLLLPGTAFVELAIHAGDQVGCEHLEELTLQTPLVVPEKTGVQVQLTVGEADNSGRRKLTVHSRPETATDTPWTQNATGVLTTISTAQQPTTDLSQWPPTGADPVDLDGFYDELAAAGLVYGPVFQGLTAAWRRGDETFAEITLPEESRETADRFALYPALLEAALHVALDVKAPAVLPATWRGVSLYAVGARTLRVRITPAASGGTALLAADESGRPVLDAESLTWRPVPLGSLQPVEQESLFRVEWQPLEEPVSYGELPVDWAEFAGSDHPDESTSAPALVMLSCPVLDGPVPDAVRAVTGTVLEAVQSWLADERFASSRLAVVTRGAVDGAEVRQSPVWGLVRAAEAENPGRFVLVDLEDPEDLDGEPEPDELRRTVAAAAATGEPGLAVRRGALHVPRLTRVPIAARTPAIDPHAWELPWDADGTVLIVGGTGGPGAALARHMVTARGVRSLLLTRHPGADAREADGLLADLAERGAEVTVAECDPADREALKRLLKRIPPKRPLAGVVYAADGEGSGLVGALAPEAVGAALRAHADGAWHLHELTSDLKSVVFVLVSGAASTLSAVGQAAHAVADGFLEALARHRRSLELPAVALAYGPWEAHEHTGRDARVRPHRPGVLPLSAEAGLALFDAVLDGVPDRGGAVSEGAVVLPMRVDTGVVRASAGAEGVPALLRGVVRVPARRTVRADEASTADRFARRLAALAAGERRRTVLDLVRTHVAAVLGHASVEAVGPDRPFQELGFDSLAAVELRNRLGAATGLLLPATLVFDHPTCQAAAEFVVGLAVPDGTDDDASVLAELDRLETLLAGLPPRHGGAVRITARLDVLLRKWQSAQADTKAEAAELSYETATDEELFEVLDSELGIG